MSETNIVGKPLTPTVKVSSLDGHRITTPVPRPVRGGSEVGAPKRALAGGQPLHPGSPDVVIGRQPGIEHVTSSSSSRTATVQGTPTSRPGRVQPNPHLVPPKAGSIARDQAELLVDLAQSYHDGLPATAKNARELAQAAAESVMRLAGVK